MVFVNLKIRKMKILTHFLYKSCIYAKIKYSLPIHTLLKVIGPTSTFVEN